MRNALLDTLGRDRVGTSRAALIAAPVKGWNTRDALADMDELYAPVLDNWFPRQGQTELRGGSTSYATGVTGGVKSLILYKKADNTGAKFFAASDSGVFDATAGGAVGATVSSCTNGYWNYVIQTNSAGTTYLWMANGVDKVKLYDGTNWTLLDGASTPAITGPTTTTLKYPWLFKHRIFCTQKNSMNLYFGPIDSIAGLFQSLPLGNLFNKGGFLVAGTSWTLDSGAGPDDLMVVITSEGQCAVFQGIDPTSASAWSLVGVWDVGRPLSPRCFFRLGGDVCVLVESGVYPLSRLLQSGQLNFKSALSNVIQPTVVDAIRTIGPTTEGWKGVVYPAQDAMVINVPGVSQQWVMNTVTGAWCSFSGWAITDMVVRSNGLYYGTSGGTIYQAWEGNLVSDSGKDITTTAHCAYTDFGLPAKQKTIEEFRPLLAYDGPVQLQFGISSDFDDIVLTNLAPRSGSNAGTPWDTSDWNTSDWSPALTRRKLWYTAFHHPGYSLALWLQTACNTSKLYWSGTNFILAQGSLL